MPAETSYRKILSRHPDRLSALIGLGRLLLRSRRYDEAVEVWQRAVAVDPENASPVFQLARALHRNGDLQRAADHYWHVVSRQPGHEKAIAALEEIGKRLVRADRLAAPLTGVAFAVEIGRRLQSLSPTVDRAREGAVAIAGAIVDSASAAAPHTPEAALARYDAALGVVPDMPEALRGAAVCFEQLGRFDSALGALNRLIEIAPEAIEPQLRRDRIQAILEDSNGRSAPEAAAVPDSPESQKRAALLDWARRLEAPEPGTPEAALDSQARAALADRAQRLLRPEKGAPVPGADPQDAEAMLARAERLSGRQATGREATVGVRHRSPLSRPDRILNRISLGQLLQQARSAEREGKLDEAEAILGQLLDADGRNTRAMAGLSRLYLRQHRWADAAAIATRLTMEEPASPEPKQMLARALLEDGRLDQAQRVYAELTELEPDNPAAWRSLGRVNGRLGNWPAARDAWRVVTRLDPERIEPRLDLAEACRQAGDTNAARAELESILAREPDHRSALTLLGRVLRIADPEASLACWSRLAELDSAAVEPWLQMARIHLREQRLPEAEMAFRMVLEQHPTHGEACASLGRILEQSDPEAAIDWFTRWSELDPTAVGPWLGMGRLQAGQHQPARADAAFRRAVELAPSDVETLTAVGRAYSASGRPDEAFTLWSKVQELAPDLLEPKVQIARILYTRRDPGAVEALLDVLKIDLQNQEALRRLTQLLERRDAAAIRAVEAWDLRGDLRRDSVPAILLRARLMEQTGQAAEAEAEYRQALALDGQHPVALDNFATLLREQERWAEAIEIYRTRLRLEPDRAETLRRIGQCFNRLDRLPEALEIYNRALLVEPGSVTTLGYRGRLLRALGQVDAAIADFRRICALDAGNPQAWRELIFWLAGAEREPEALAALEDAEATLGKTPETWMALGGAAAAALFEERAIAYYQRAIAAQPENPACHAQLGLHYLRQGVPDGAFHHLLDSRELDPRNVEVAKGLFDTTRLLRELGFDPLAMRRGVPTVGEILVPEQLFAHVMRIAETRVEPYDPMPRRVVAISATLAPGGAERQLVTMLRGLGNRAFGLDLALFCISLTSSLRRDFFLPLLEDAGVEIVVPDPRATEDYLWHPEVVPFADVIRHFPADMTGPIAFWLREFRRRRPQVVHAWQDSTNLTAVVAALLAGVPRIILCCRSVRPDNPRRRLRRFMREAYRAVLEHPAVVLSNNSRAGANDYAEWLGLAPERVEVVYNGIDFDRLDSAVDSEETARARQALGIPPGAPVLGGIYRMSEEKRPLLWLDVAAAVARQNDAAHFVVCGDGPMRDEMRSHAAALGIADRVHLPGPQSNIGSWYRMMDVVLLTSRHEGLPNVLLEAQALGVPVVAPDVGGMSEVVEQGVTGWTIGDADAVRLAERVLHCLTDRDWRQVAAERAPHFVRNRFGVETMLRRNLEVYGMAIEN
ncbi:tetratricopeptide repeat protein [Reyranella sp.]|uniref:tetratricopeptide repeat protein n=1 Tax=Reyranella sp. TaxID=1929291 RepID=UPI003D104587